MKQDEFTMTFENALSDDWCDRCIEEFEKARGKGLGSSRNRIIGNDFIQDEQVDFDLIPEEPECNKIIKELKQIFFGQFYYLYYQRFPVLSNPAEVVLTGFCVQKTLPGQGYHLWHFENSRVDLNRVLVYTVSLNDIEEGGETEFLYQHFRLKQKKGSLTIFPASFTHTHRGNPPLSGTKYIMTGWISYLRIPD